MPLTRTRLMEAMLRHPFGCEMSRWASMSKQNDGSFERIGNEAAFSFHETPMYDSMMRPGRVPPHQRN